MSCCGASEVEHHRGAENALYLEQRRWAVGAVTAHAMLVDGPYRLIALSAHGHSTREIVAAVGQASQPSSCNFVILHKQGKTHRSHLRA